MVGEQLGNYRVLEKIGEGGMGAVYRAVDVMLERDVALKFLRPELASQPDLVERFRAEAVVLARLSHPHIAAIYGLHRHDDQFFMAMEFVHGDTLETLLARQGRLEPGHAAAIAAMVLAALDYAHRQGVVHRDIKTANIIVGADGAAKVMDFGIARVLGGQRHTRVGFVVGTVGYMSPEQIQGREVDGRSDLYSLGLVLYEMLAGRLPFEADTEWALMQAQVQEAPPPISSFAPVGPPLEGTVLRALEKSPAARFQTATEFRRALVTSGVLPATTGELHLDVPPAPGQLSRQLPPRATPLPFAAPYEETAMYVPLNERPGATLRPSAERERAASGAHEGAAARKPSDAHAAEATHGTRPAPDADLRVVTHEIVHASEAGVVGTGASAELPPKPAGAETPVPMVKVAPAPASKAARPQASGRRAWMPAAAALAVVAAAAGGFFMWSRLRPTAAGQSQAPVQVAATTADALVPVTALDGAGAIEAPPAPPSGAAVSAPAPPVPPAVPGVAPRGAAGAPAAGGTGSGSGAGTKPGAAATAKTAEGRQGSGDAAKTVRPGPGARGAAGKAAGAGATAPDGRAQPKAVTTAGRAEEAVAAPVEPPVTKVATPVRFDKIKLVQERGPEIDAVLDLAGDRLEVRNVGGRNVLKSLAYAAITGASYAESKHSRLVVSTTRYWLTVTSGAETVRLRLDKDNRQAVLEAFKRRSGKPVATGAEPGQ